MQVYLLLGLIFSLGVAVFAVQNSTRVNISLFFWQLGDISLVLIIFGSALIGAAATGLFGAVKQLQLRKTIKNYKTQTEEYKQEIVSLHKELNILKDAQKPENNIEKQTP